MSSLPPDWSGLDRFDFVGFEENFLTGLLTITHMGRHVGVTVRFGFQIITLEALEIEIRHCGAVDALLPSRQGLPSYHKALSWCYRSCWIAIETHWNTTI